MEKNNLIKRLVPISFTILVVSALIALASLGVWFLFRIFLPWLQYFHVLILFIVLAIYCAWYSFAKSLREASKTIRIMEQVVLIVFFVAIVAFISLKITS